MDWQYLVVNYGYLAILVGTFLEGESILVIGGFAAHQGYLHLPWVLMSAFIGSFAGDQLFFFIGRFQGKKLLARYPRWQARVMRVHQLMERWHTTFILVFRFLYGLRTISPFVIGTSPVGTRRFFFLNMIGAAVWAVTIGVSGYLFGEVLELALGRVKQYEKWILLGIVVIGVTVTLGLRWRSRRKGAQQQAAPATLPPPSMEDTYK